MKMSDYSLSLVREEQEKCIGCKACMKGCPMLHKYCHNPKDLLTELLNEGAFDYKLPYSCMLCGYCAEVCPTGVDLKALFLQLRKDVVNESKGKLPKELNSKAVDFHQSFSFSRIFTSDIQNLQSRTIFFPGCALMANSPEIVENTYNYLREVIPGTGIYAKCCGKPTLFMGKEGKFREYFGILEKEFREKGVERIITGCQNCFMTIGQNSKGLEVVSLWEVLATKGIPKEKVGIGKDLDSDFTLHDPCPTRSVNIIHESVRSILEQLGLSYGEMKFNRNRTLCCGSGGMVGLTEPKIAKDHTSRRASEASADYIITYCQECTESMRRGGKKSYHILDLLFRDDFQNMKQENKGAIEKWLNRYRGKNIGK